MSSLSVHAYSGKDDVLRWEVIADPDDPTAGIIMRFATIEEAETFLSGAGYRPANKPMFLSRAYEKRSVVAYWHPASSQVVLAKRRLTLV